MTSRELRLQVNGVRYLARVEPRWTLADTLRERCGLTGTHLGCEHGVCGACTVLLDGEPIRSCLIFAVQCEGRSIRTVEGLEGPDGSQHPLQTAFTAAHALQCGFCTPGFLMLSAGLLEQDLDAGPEDIREALSSNLCRCTGYINIFSAVLEAQRLLQCDVASPVGTQETS